jgi:hypothetical protein
MSPEPRDYRESDDVDENGTEHMTTDPNRIESFYEPGEGQNPGADPGPRHGGGDVSSPVDEDWSDASAGSEWRDDVTGEPEPPEPAQSDKLEHHAETLARHFAAYFGASLNEARKWAEQAFALGWRPA